MGLFGRLFGRTQVAELAPDGEILGDHRVKLHYQEKPTDPCVEIVPIGTPITRERFMQIKAWLSEYKALSVRELAKRAGLHRSTVYRIKAVRSYKAYKDARK